MPAYCCVYGCGSDAEVHKELNYHQFPSNKKQAKLWEKRIRRFNFRITGSSIVCSRHFLKTDYGKPNKDTPPQFQKKKAEARCCSVRQFERPRS